MKEINIWILKQCKFLNGVCVCGRGGIKQKQKSKQKIKIKYIDSSIELVIMKLSLLKRCLIKRKRKPKRLTHLTQNYQTLQSFNSLEILTFHSVMGKQTWVYFQKMDFVNSPYNASEELLLKIILSSYRLRHPYSGNF